MNKLSVIEIDFDDYIEVMEIFLKRINKNTNVNDDIIHNINILENSSFKDNKFMKQLF